MNEVLSVVSGWRQLSLLVLLFITCDTFAARRARNRPLDQLDIKLLHTLRRHNEPIVQIAFASAGNTLATTARGNAIVFWNAQNGQIEFVRPIVDGKNLANHKLSGIDYGGVGGRLLATSSQTPWDTSSGALVVWNSRGQYLRTDAKVAKSFTCSAIERNGPFLAAGSHNSIVRLWDTRRLMPVVNGKKKAGAFYLELPSGLALPSAISALEFCSSGRETKLAVGCYKGGIHLMNVDADGGLNEVVGHFTNQSRKRVRDLAFNSVEKLVAAATDDDEVRCWDLSTGQLKFKLAVGGGDATSVCFDNSGRLIAVGCSNGTVRIWNLANLTSALTKLDGGAKLIRSIAFSADDQYFAAGGDDSAVRVWSMFARKRKKT